MMKLQWVTHQDLHLPLFFFAIMKKFDFKIVLLNLNLLSIKRCIDDTFLLFGSKHHIEKPRNYLNGQHKNIRFTSEIENENSISFLDISISKDNNKFATSVYHKPTSSGVFTNFGSFIPKSCKYNLLFTLTHRAFKLCSNFELFHLEIHKLKTNFENNSYLKSFVDLCIKKYLDKVFFKKGSSTESFKKRTYLHPFFYWK